MTTARLALAAAFAIAVTAPFAAQEKIDADINAKIRQEGLNNSQIMRTLHYLTDVHGPRVTGSPGLEAAGKWAIKTMESWGFTNGKMDPWDWGRPGWTNDFAMGAITAPVKDKLEFEVLAWTPGTAGTIDVEAVNIVLPDQPTKPELDAFLDTVRDKVKSRAVLVGRHRTVPVNFTPPAKRRSDEQVKAQYDPNNPGGGRGGRGGGGRGDQPSREGALEAREVARILDEFLVASGAKVRINDAGREHGQIIAFQNRTYDLAKAVPTVVMRNEDYGRIARILADGTPVKLQFNIANSTYPEGKTAYNATADIVGSDKKNEIVMLGGHLDSWHSATGATDNAIGCAVMMEAARILKAIGVQPRRTIRVALWSGEEQGILGSQAYVKQHFGAFEEPKPGFKNLVAYLNIDSGTGRARGANVFGPPAAAKIVREILAPFEDFGVFGASPSSGRNVGGTDHTAFNNAGLTGIGFGQDPIEYGSHTHHTNLDTYERVVEQDVKQSAIVIASVLYHLAMRDEPLPRFTAADMPARPAPRGGTQ